MGPIPDVCRGDGVLFDVDEFAEDPGVDTAPGCFSFAPGNSSSILSLKYCQKLYLLRTQLLLNILSYSCFIYNEKFNRILQVYLQCCLRILLIIIMNIRRSLCKYNNYNYFFFFYSTYLIVWQRQY